jgi:hypothetical protein
MDETFARISFDATLDEARRSDAQALQRSEGGPVWRRTATLSAGATVGVLFLFVSSPLWRQGQGVFILFAIAVLLAILVGFLAGHAHDHSYMRRVLQYLAERLQGAQTLRCDI